MLCLMYVYECLSSKCLNFIVKSANITPQRIDPSNPLSTPLATVPSSFELATRVAKIVAKRTNLPVYVGCSVHLGGASMEEELEGMKLIVTTIMTEVEGEKPTVTR